MNRTPTLALLIALSLTAVIVFTGCPAQPTTTSGGYQWPRTFNMLAIGTSGMTKTVSWASMMEADTGMTIRVQSEESYAHAGRLMKQQKFPLAEFSTSTLSSMVEAMDEFALKDGGPWMPAAVWSASFGSTGFLVRGDSGIFTPKDLKPGMKMAVSRKTEGMMRMYHSLLAWAGLEDSDMLWLETGDTPSAVRAVVDGRAHFVMCPPTGEYVYEAVASPESARFIDLNSEKDPEGAIRFQNIGVMYGFAPIRNGPKQVQGIWSVSGPRLYWSYYDSDPDVIYNMVRWLDDNYDKYKDRFDSNIWMTQEILIDGLAESFVPFHPGLVRYLKEEGIWNADYEKRDKYNYDLVKTYIDAYPKAIAAAEAQGISITPTNQKWIEFWENYKAQNKLVILRKHPSISVTAPVTYNAGYQQPIPQPTPSPTPTPTVVQPPPSTDVPIQVVSTAKLNIGASDATVVVKTEPGAEVTIQVKLPGTGTISAQPPVKTQTAGADGIVTWKFSISTHTKTGEATLTFTAKKDGKTGILVYPAQFTQ